MVPLEFGAMIVLCPAEMFEAALTSGGRDLVVLVVILWLLCYFVCFQLVSFVACFSCVVDVDFK